VHRLVDYSGKDFVYESQTRLPVSATVVSNLASPTAAHAGFCTGPRHARHVRYRFDAPLPTAFVSAGLAWHELYGEMGT
jgi:hypothetical protein